MICDRVQLALSARLDGEEDEADDAVAADAAEVDTHLAGCAACQSFERISLELRQVLRLEPVDEPTTDLAHRILDSLPPSQPHPLQSAAADGDIRHHLPPSRGVGGWRSVAAAAVVGALAGASFAGVTDGPDPVAAADLPAMVVASQPAVTTLAATVTVDAGGETWTGTLRYRAPESLAIVLHDTDGALLASVADGDRWWIAGPRRCQAASAAPCAPPLSRAVTGRAPFAPDAPVPVEFAAPVDAFVRSAPPQLIGGRDDAVGVLVTAAQVATLLDGLDPTGALRPVHPTDMVELWLDDGTFVPVELVVRAAATDERARWAAGLGLRDGPGGVVLTMRLSDLVVDGAVDDADFPVAPPGTPERDDGFVLGDPGSDVPLPTDLPAGLRPGRAGRFPGGAVRTWSDGRAWVAVRRIEAPSSPESHGQAVDLGAGAIGYFSANQDTITLDLADGRVEVAGSVGPEALVRIASSLGVAGRIKVASTLAAARAVAPDLLVADDPPGFAPPSVHVGGDEVRLRYAGAGDRFVVVVRSAATALAPPLEPDVIAVEVRGVAGRWRAASGDLEWVEEGHVRALRSTTVSLAELIAFADGLRRP